MLLQSWLRIHFFTLSLFFYVLNSGNVNAQLPNLRWENRKITGNLFRDFQELQDFQSQDLCNRSRDSSFTLSRRGGLPPTPYQNLSNEAVQVSLVEAIPVVQTQSLKTTPKKSSVSSLHVAEKEPLPAQGWIYNHQGDIVLVANNPAFSRPQRLKKDSVCSQKGY